MQADALCSETSHALELRIPDASVNDSLRAIRVERATVSALESRMRVSIEVIVVLINHLVVHAEELTNQFTNFAKSRMDGNLNITAGIPFHPEKVLQWPLAQPPGEIL